MTLLRQQVSSKYMRAVAIIQLSYATTKQSSQHTRLRFSLPPSTCKSNHAQIAADRRTNLTACGACSVDKRKQSRSNKTQNVVLGTGSFLSQVIWLWEPHNLPKMTLYSLKSIRDAPLTATPDTSGDKSTADHERDQAVLHSICRKISCSFIPGTSLVKTNHLEISPSRPIYPNQQVGHCKVALPMILSDYCKAAVVLTVCGSDGNQQRLSPYTVNLAAAPVTRRKLERL